MSTLDNYDIDKQLDRTKRKKKYAEKMKKLRNQNPKNRGYGGDKGNFLSMNQHLKDIRMRYK